MTSLLKETTELLAWARARLSEEQHTPNMKEIHSMEASIDTAETTKRAGELYAAGKTVFEVAQEIGTPYAKTRKLIVASGTPIRDASARLKGRTRSKKTSA